MSNPVYDQIAEEYKYSKQLLFRKAVEEYTLLKIAGNFQGLSVLDLACGEGIYTRLFKEMGAQKAVGVDISPEMVKLARVEESENPQGCVYYVGDAKNIGVGQKFDLIIRSLSVELRYQ